MRVLVRFSGPPSSHCPAAHHLSRHTRVHLRSSPLTLSHTFYGITAVSRLSGIAARRRSIFGCARRTHRPNTGSPTTARPMANAADLAAEKAVLTQRVALSMKTVADQQHIIAGLQALVDALKARVQELEAARERDTSARTSATAPAPCALTHTATLTEVERLRGQNSRLRQAVADLQLQRESLTSAQRTTASQLETLTQTVLSQQSDLTRLRTQEALWEKEKAMLLLTQTQRQQVESEAMILRDDADFERQIKTKWRALALTIAERLDEGWQTQLQSRFFTLAEEERRYRERRDARVHLSPVLPRRSLTAPASERRTAPSVQPALPTPSQAALSLWSRTAASRTDDDR